MSSFKCKILLLKIKNHSSITIIIKISSLITCEILRILPSILYFLEDLQPVIKIQNLNNPISSKIQANLKDLFTQNLKG